VRFSFSLRGTCLNPFPLPHTHWGLKFSLIGLFNSTWQAYTKVPYCMYSMTPHFILPYANICSTPCRYKISFSSQMLPSADYNFIPKSGTRLNFIILALLFLLFVYAFFEYLCSLLRISLLWYLGGRSKTEPEPPYYIIGLYLFYHSCNSSSR